jgi:hypothetical protein
MTFERERGKYAVENEWEEDLIHYRCVVKSFYDG